MSLLLGLFFLVSACCRVRCRSDLLRWARLSEVYAETYALVYLVFGVLGYVMLGIAAGQFCSMFFRSPLLAGLFSIVLTAVLAAWCGLMFFWQVNWLWSVLPIPLALLLATRLHTADWLLERQQLASVAAAGLGAAGSRRRAVDRGSALSRPLRFPWSIPASRPRSLLNP